MRHLIRASAIAVLIAMTACGAAPSTIDSPTATAENPALLSATSGGEEPIVGVVAAATPSVVTVKSVVRSLTPFGPRDGEAVGTGFVVRADGYVLTNNHVVDGASAVTVTTASGDQYPASVVTTDAEHDLAVLKIDARGLPALTLGSSDGLAVGESVVAIGFALDLSGGPTVTSGILSSLDRSIDVQDSSGSGPSVRTYEGLLQTDAALNHGNSGGPLLSLDRQVIGVNVAGGDSVENIGFAIPIDTAQPLLDQAFGQAA